MATFALPSLQKLVFCCHCSLHALQNDAVPWAVQAQEQALKQLNFLKNGTDYPDRSILDGFTEDNLRTRIGRQP